MMQYYIIINEQQQSILRHCPTHILLLLYYYQMQNLKCSSKPNKHWNKNPSLLVGIEPLTIQMHTAVLFMEQISYNFIHEIKL